MVFAILVLCSHPPLIFRGRMRVKTLAAITAWEAGEKSFPGFAEDHVNFILVESGLVSQVLHRFDGAFGIAHAVSIVGSDAHVIGPNPFEAAFHCREIEGRGVGIHPVLVGDVGRFFQLDAPFLAVSFIGILVACGRSREPCRLGARE